MIRKINHKGFWNMISLLTISKTAVIGLAIITSIALILNETYQIF